MIDDTRANEQVETTNQPEPMPSSEQTTQPVQPTENVSERTTEQFEKLKAHNKMLADKLAEYEAPKPLFDNVRQTPQKPANDPLWDPNTGYVNVNELENTRDAAFAAQLEIQALKEDMRRREQEAEVREAYSAYPELDPEGEKHDKELFTATRAFLLDSAAHPDEYKGGLTVKQATERAKALISRGLGDAEKAGATKAIEGLTPKEQAAFEASGRSDRRNDTNQETLIQRTRENDYYAIAERMKNLR